MISHTSMYALNDQVNIGSIFGIIEEIIFRRNCIQPLYCVSYWHEGEQKLITVPEQDITR